MITRRTVLVLGAGASIPFGFPSGIGLKMRVLLDLQKTNPPGFRYNKMLEVGFRADQIDDFRLALERSGKLSVDAFLEHRTEFLEVGKAAIAVALQPLERTELLFGKEPNWYAYFYNKLNTGFEEFRRNSVSVLTFNYDRSLEHYLYTALVNSYGKSPEECADRLRSIPVLHLYGQLGEYPPIGAADRSIDYDSALDAGYIRRAASGIRIIHETGGTTEIFARARFLINDAQLVMLHRVRL